MPTRLYKTGFGTTDTPADIFTMFANPSTASAYYAFYYSGVSFLVPTATSLYITKIQWSGNTTGSLQFRIHFGTTAIVNTTTVIAGDVQRTSNFDLAAINTIYTQETFIPIPALNYPHVVQIGAGTLNILISCINV